MVILKYKDKFVLLNRKRNRVLGIFSAKELALKREKQIEYFKSKKKGNKKFFKFFKK